jgi:hypothetical protein
MVNTNADLDRSLQLRNEHENFPRHLGIIGQGISNNFRQNNGLLRHKMRAGARASFLKVQNPSVTRQKLLNWYNS